MKIHRKPVNFALLGAVWALACGLAAAQQPVQVVQPISHTVETLALTFPEGKTISLKLKGTERLPKASGEAKVERKKGTTEIEIELDEMKPAESFGGDFNVYVLWSSSPEGLASNLGEFVLDGNRSKLNVSSRLETFGLFITAEPHYLVRKPSRFVVLETLRPADNLRIPFQSARIVYRGAEGVYKADRESLANVAESKSEIRSDVGQARTAFQLAAAANAEQLASDKFVSAKLALQKTDEAVQGGVDKKRVLELAKETVRYSYEAQITAEQRAAQLALDAERKAAAERERQAQAAQEAEARRRAEAERQRAEEERRRQAAELAAAQEAQRRAEAEAQQREAELAAAREAQRRAEAEAQRRDAELNAAREAQQRAEAAAQAQRAREAEQQAREAAARAEREKQELRARLLAQFNRVLPTKDTDRGLQVNMGDVLFDTGKAELRGPAREALAKLSGIVLNYPSLKLDIEGHTDSTGTHEFNQTLSEKRAAAVRDYLVSQGIPAEALSAIGFAETRPAADNKTAQGRQQNRRVEIIVSGEVIGTRVGTL